MNKDKNKNNKNKRGTTDRSDNDADTKLTKRRRRNSGTPGTDGDVPGSCSRAAPSLEVTEASEEGSDSGSEFSWAEQDSDNSGLFRDPTPPIPDARSAEVAASSGLTGGERDFLAEMVTSEEAAKTAETKGIFEGALEKLSEWFSKFPECSEHAAETADCDHCTSTKVNRGRRSELKKIRNDFASAADGERSLDAARSLFSRLEKRPKGNEIATTVDEITEAYRKGTSFNEDPTQDPTRRSTAAWLATVLSKELAFKAEMRAAIALSLGENLEEDEDELQKAIANSLALQIRAEREANAGEGPSRERDF